MSLLERQNTAFRPKVTISHSMDRIPTEILEHILDHACTDGGQAGNALAAVSCYIRDVSTPVRYNSIALRGARQIRAFCKLLDNVKQPTPPLLKRGTIQRWKEKTPTNHQHAGRPALSTRTIRVRHLFLADCAKDRFAYDITNPIWTEWQHNTHTKTSALSSLVQAMIKGRDRNEQWRVANAAISSAELAITNLLTRLAPSLQHLCYDQALASLALFRVMLPALEELTCRVDHRWTCEFYETEPSSSTQMVLTPRRVPFLLQLPALKNLHVVLKGMNWGNDFPQELPPALQRVRFSDAVNPARLVTMLTENANGPWLTQDSLRTILVSHKRHDSYALDQPVSAQLVEHDHQGVLHKIHVVEDLEDYDVHRLYEEWLERAQGGQGCWKETTHMSLLLGARV